MSTSQARAVADVTAGIILAQVEIAAPAERVYRALTSDEVTQWWGEDGAYHTTHWQADVRVGGSWKASGTSADGSAFAVQGEYLVLEPPHRVVQTWRADWDGGATTTVAYTLKATESGTLLTVRHEGFAADQQASCESHGEGWQAVLQWLHRWLIAPAVAEPAAQPLRYLLRLLPPRSSFATDMTPQEQAAMQAHAGYWSAQMDAGRAILFGPVLDAAGVWGLLALEVESEQEMHALKDADPALRGIAGMRWEVLPFLQSAARPHSCPPRT